MQRDFEKHVLKSLGVIQEQLCTLKERLDKIMATQAEQTAQLQAISDGLDALGTQLTKGLGEVTSEIAALQAAVAAGGASTPAMDALFASINTKLATVKVTGQAIDDLNPG